MFNVEYGAPLYGVRRERLRGFLNRFSIDFGLDADFTVMLTDYKGEIAATGSLSKNVLKYIAVSEEEQGTGAAATVVSELINYAYRSGIEHLFLFTKPKNEILFSSLGFFPLAKTDEAVMMENKKNGLSYYLNNLERPAEKNNIGAVVMNCNPFTLGHRYLIETAARELNALHVFILSADESEFSSAVRYDLVKRGTADLKNIFIHESADYLISHATFPTYFLKANANPETINSDLDITLFGTRIAPALNISARFCGSEPFCPITRAYNGRLRALLPKFSIDFVEIPRFNGISASKVREYMKRGEIEKVRELVPETTYDYLILRNDMKQ
ncbi:MAG: [citrate (pro-3S)-lyase] ligase [Clostridia bacterium]